ncbi:DUF1572 family protein [Paenibacillus sp. CGMCC 1.16610]|uniref:DUF1572 domain-containing protein n=1 Tax=Paenibacillus anseongense TaxID=2682845 RepID=A0ABW9UB83_9BACL|nr:MULTISPECIES: DUF1572 family protein [Paenibacillus]MBA2937475.1 DUF1572 family protein [Paenibacillus sp. CGMCC 1.16610]MVQ36533.1 DUF1572 domain-containing protein [Paenibacillus anseongense]
MNEIKNILNDRFEAIERRIVLVLEQLDDEQVNWRPNDSSNSISNLIVHISGNINDRIGKGMNKRPFTRDRDGEFEVQVITKNDLIEIIKTSLREVKVTLMAMNNEGLLETQKTGNREQTNLEIFIQSATHFSEHMGQILYIAKILKDEDYVTTTVPKKKRV